jgi:lauroyl/myristoyl acyltransferase
MQEHAAAVDSSTAVIRANTQGQSAVRRASSASPSESVAIPAILFEDPTILELFPIVVRLINEAECNIVRVGAPVITAISTSSMGLEAVRLLQSGQSVGAVKAALGKKYDSAATDISPLITALYKARIIRRAADTLVCDEKPRFWRVFTQKCAWAGFSARRAVVGGLLKYLALRVSYPILFQVRPRWSRAKRLGALRLTQQNLHRVFGASLLPSHTDRIAEDFISEQIRRDLDIEILNAFSDLRVAKWMRGACTISGLNYLDEALSRNQGVMLSSFHFSSSHLIILVLWLHGYSFTGAGGITRAANSRTLPFDNPELEAQLGGCGKVKWFSHFNFDSVLAMCKALERGGMVLVYPDSIWARPAKDVAKYFGHGAAQYRPARTVVPFLGHKAEANKGVPWIYKQSQAPLIPLKLIRTSNSRFHLSIGPELKLNREASVEAIAAELYRALEREVCIDPAAWSYWRILHQFLTSGDSQEGEAPVRNPEQGFVPGSSESGPTIKKGETHERQSSR